MRDRSAAGAPSTDAAYEKFASPRSVADLHLLIAEAKGLAGLGMEKGYDDLLYKLCDALDDLLARAERRDA